MVKISDFSRLSLVTVKALRHYDDIGLFKPAYVDHLTGYRYYTVEQMPRLKRILALKEMGLALEQIRQILNEAISQEQIVGMLRLKRAELQQQVQMEQTRLARLETWLRQFEQEKNMYEVKVKSVPAILVASMRSVVPDRSQFGMVFNRLFGTLRQVMEENQKTAEFAGPAIALYHDEEYCEQNIQVEATCPITGHIREGSEVVVRELPAVSEMAYVEHRGPFTGLPGAFDALLQWIETQHYTINGAGREVYVHYNPQDDPSAWLTEVQFPVIKQTASV